MSNAIWIQLKARSCTKGRHSTSHKALYPLPYFRPERPLKAQLGSRPFWGNYTPTCLPKCQLKRRYFLLLQRLVWDPKGEHWLFLGYKLKQPFLEKQTLLLLYESWSMGSSPQGSPHFLLLILKTSQQPSRPSSSLSAATFTAKYWLGSHHPPLGLPQLRSTMGK